MGNKYVSIYGDSGNAGTGPLHNQAWRYIDTAMDAMDDGDVLYVGPGIYRECVSPADSPAAARTIRGDPMNTQGFTDSSDVLLTPDPCIITNLLTNDVSAATNTATFTTNAKDYWTLENLWLESNSSQAALIILNGSEHVTVRDCFIQGPLYACTIACTADVNSAVLIERCVILHGNANVGAINITIPKTNNAEYDCGITIRNNVIQSPAYCVSIVSSASGTNYGANVNVQNCVLFGNRGLNVSTNYAGTLTTYFLNVKNCLICAGSGIVQGTAAVTVVVEDYNHIWSPTPRTNVAVSGTHDVVYESNSFSSSFRHDFGQAQLLGFLPKSFFAPWSTSRTIGYGNDSSPAALTVDLLNRVRPSGSGVAAASVLNSVGAYELHDYGVKETTVKDAGDASIKLTGPGDHDIRVPVDASATVISIKARFDSATYGGANYPQAILLDAADIGVSTETKTATIAASDAWETLTFSSFTPTLKGWVVIRLLNRGSGADDICYFDTLAVT